LRHAADSSNTVCDKLLFQFQTLISM